MVFFFCNEFQNGNNALGCVFGLGNYIFQKSVNISFKARKKYKSI